MRGYHQAFNNFGMSPIDRWNTFATYADPAVAFILLFAGIGLLASQRKLAISRQARVDRGEMTKAAAAENEKFVKICSCVLAVCGALLVVMWLIAVEGKTTQ